MIPGLGMLVKAALDDKDKQQQGKSAGKTQRPTARFPIGFPVKEPKGRSR